MWMMKNSSGKKDAMLSFAVGGFVITAIAVILSFIETITIASYTFKTRPPDVALITVFLSSTLIAYVTRRNKKDAIAARKEEIMLKAKYGLDTGLLQEMEAEDEK